MIPSYQISLDGILKCNEIWIIPIVHHRMELTSLVHLLLKKYAPAAIAVELPTPLHSLFLDAVDRLPVVTLLTTILQAEGHAEEEGEKQYFLIHSCDPLYEALRLARDLKIPSYSIDCGVIGYGENSDHLPDTVALESISLDEYYRAYRDSIPPPPTSLDLEREATMVQNLRSISARHGLTIACVGFYHAHRIATALATASEPSHSLSATKAPVHFVESQLFHLPEKSIRELLPECGFFVQQYEFWREQQSSPNAHLISLPPRYHILIALYRLASKLYGQKTGHLFPNYHLRNLVQFARNYSWVTQRLFPDLFQIIAAARGCVDSNYAYYTWLIATTLPYDQNIENFPLATPTIEEVWGRSKTVRFFLKERSTKSQNYLKRSELQQHKSPFPPPLFYTICSYPPEDVSIEAFGEYLKKRGIQLSAEENATIIPFSGSTEDGIDTRETIRHWNEKRLYIRKQGRPQGNTGSVVVIFDLGLSTPHKYPYASTWHGEHSQESDMAFYATNPYDQIVGPGICRCQYGGYLLSYPPRRMSNVWEDPDFGGFESRAEVLLVAGILYSQQPLVVYLAPEPPTSFIKNIATRYNKKIIYIPLSQISPPLLNKIRIFHVLDGHHRRDTADDYIF